MQNRLPKLREDIQFIPTELQGQQVLVVKDPLALFEKVIVLAQEAAVILPLFDGKHTRGDVATLFERVTGQSISNQVVETIVSDLERLVLLQTEQYHHLLAQKESDWKAENTRKPAHAGQAYPIERNSLNEFINQILQRCQTQSKPRPKALVAPHLDPKWGALGYAHAYSGLGDLRPQRILLFGTGHTLAAPVSVCRKTFETPLGASEVDRSAVDRLKDSYPHLVLDEMAHINEHSLEFQLVFLHHLFGSEPKVVPILFGSLYEVIRSSRGRLEELALWEFYQACKQLIQDENTLVVAGIDLSHIGPKFGHTQIAKQLHDEALQHDNAILEAATRCDAQGLFETVTHVQDRYNICGFPALLALLSCLDNHQGHILHHDIWHEAETKSAVSFASMWFTTR